MKIILMRHGNALSGSPDAARRLSKQGVDEATASGNFLRSIGEFPQIILHSGLRRSLETAEYVEKALGVSGVLRLHGGLKPNDSPGDFYSDIQTAFCEYDCLDGSIMIVGHEPFMSELAALIMKHALTFGTGTLLMAERNQHEYTWYLRFYVQAKYLVKAFDSVS